jgi:16S rRNA (guanine527-N7)-methyltransferase
MDFLSDSYSRFLLAAGELKVTLPPDFRPRLAAYCALLTEANEQLNLTRITDPEAFLFKHALDSLALLPLLDKPFDSLCDIGSGGGAPGLVLALARPVRRLALVERTRKKADFLRQAAAALGIAAEVAAVNSPEYHPAVPFSLVTARAAGRAEHAPADAAHLVAANGVLALYQGPSLDAGLAAVLGEAGKCGLARHRVAAYTVPQAGERRMLLLQK